MCVDENFITTLKTKLRYKLPGKNAQFFMAPEVRKNLKDFDYTECNPTDCGVLLSLFYFENKLCTTFILRAEDNHAHSGQIALPGGRKEKSDKTIEETALREAYEEVGIIPNNVEILGQLTDLYIYPSNYVVYPVVGFCSDPPNFIIDSIEVQQILIFPIKELLNEKNKSIKSIKTSFGYEIEAPYYNIYGHVLWGATAMIISEFVEIIRVCP